MSNIDNVISLLESKIGRVVQVAERLYSDNEQLRQRVNELFGQLDAKSLEVKVLESKYQNLKLTKTLASSLDEVKDVKLQVNRMVREIDKCIALLNR